MFENDADISEGGFIANYPSNVRRRLNAPDLCIKIALTRPSPHTVDRQLFIYDLPEVARRLRA